ncbi:uncharacterized protein G2W53_001562 [Senna tora]|uniref:Uncharacterized protein n=1 Tax=Senna tora TaxID=362788 RepID=A0A834XIC0_9FABA|nr:uncharacterized protein G2W53_001562 [Senna tora]
MSASPYKSYESKSCSGYSESSPNTSRLQLSFNLIEAIVSDGIVYIEPVQHPRPLKRAMEQCLVKELHVETELEEFTGTNDEQSDVVVGGFAMNG